MSAIPAHFREAVLTISDDGGNSETLTLHNGDHTLGGLVYEGAELEDYQSAGRWVGSRLGARVFPTFSVSGILSDPANAFNLLALGKKPGFVSTALGIGDAPHVDLSFSFSYGGETRTITAQDVAFSVEMGIASPAKVSFSGTIKGPVVNNGTTIITAR
jgi:hypothetical protein